jgi:co-chaperonin GroES (HSP10)
MQIIHDYFIVLMDKKYNSEPTESGMIKVNEAYMEDWAEEHLKHRRQYGTVLEVPLGYTHELLDIVHIGMPEPRVFLSGDFIGKKVNEGFTKLPQYNPSTFDGFDLITLDDISKLVNVRKGDKIYFDYTVASPDRFLGKFGDKGDMYMVRVDEIYCSVRYSRFKNDDGNFTYIIIPHGGWCLVEPAMESWEEIETESGILIKPKPTARYLDGIVRHIRDRDDVKAGDRILYQRHADYTVSIEEIDYFVMKEEDILCRRV